MSPPLKSQHTHERKSRSCSGFSGDRLKAKNPARAAHHHPSPAGNAAPPRRSPVSQALVLLKDQTRSCLVITLILFSTWLYYLLGLLWERQLWRVILSIHFLPQKAGTRTRTSPLTPWNCLVLQPPLRTGQMFIQVPVPPRSEEESLGSWRGGSAK